MTCKEKSHSYRHKERAFRNTFHSLPEHSQTKPKNGLQVYYIILSGRLQAIQKGIIYMNKENLIEVLFNNWYHDITATEKSKAAFFKLSENANDRIEVTKAVIDIATSESERAFFAGFKTALALMEDTE